MQSIAFRKIFIMAAIFGLTASMAQAQDNDPDVTSYYFPYYYVGIGFGGGVENPGFSELGFNEYTAATYSGVTDCASLSCVSTADGGMGLKVFGGIKLNPYFGAEAFIAGLGGMTSLTDYNNTLIMAETEANFIAFGATANGYLPVGDYIDLTGKAGLHIWSASGSTYILDGTPSTRDFNEAGLGAVVGAGFQIRSALGLRFEYEYYMGNAQDVTFGVGFFSMSVIVPFQL